MDVVNVSINNNVHNSYFSERGGKTPEFNKAVHKKNFRTSLDKHPFAVSGRCLVNMKSSKLNGNLSITDEVDKMSKHIKVNGLQNKLLSEEEISQFKKGLTSLSNSLKNMPDDDFDNLKIIQDYSKNDFITSVLNKVEDADLPESETKKVFDYFGFKLIQNPECRNEKYPNNITGHSIVGYPLNLENKEKLATIKNPKTRELMEDVRQDIIRFTENNKIYSNNEEFANGLNIVLEFLPELQPAINKAQHPIHDFDIMKHSLKVAQKIVQNPMYDELSESDKNIMLLGGLLHDITKAEGVRDPNHAHTSANDAYFITKKFNMTEREENKLNKLIDTHDWLGYVNNPKIDEDERNARKRVMADKLGNDNMCDMSLIFTQADLHAISFGEQYLAKKFSDDAKNHISAMKHILGK